MEPIDRQLRRKFYTFCILDVKKMLCTPMVVFQPLHGLVVHLWSRATYCVDNTIARRMAVFMKHWAR